MVKIVTLYSWEILKDATHLKAKKCIGSINDWPISSPIDVGCSPNSWEIRATKLPSWKPGLENWLSHQQVGVYWLIMLKFEHLCDDDKMISPVCLCGVYVCVCHRCWFCNMLYSCLEVNIADWWVTAVSFAPFHFHCFCLFGVFTNGCYVFTSPRFSSLPRHLKPQVFTSIGGVCRLLNIVCQSLDTSRFFSWRRLCFFNYLCSSSVYQSMSVMRCIYADFMQIYAYYAFIV